MTHPIRVAILEDHVMELKGYMATLNAAPEVKLVAVARYGEALLPMLAEYGVDVLILDVTVPTSAGNQNSYALFPSISEALDLYPQLNILIISMHKERSLIEAVLEAGASGYLLKDDVEAMEGLVAIIVAIAHGEIYLSQPVRELLRRRLSIGDGHDLTPRQIQALSLCVAYPDLSTSDLAAKLAVAHSTMRNLLSNAYVRLGVSNRAAAIGKVREMGLMAPHIPPPKIPAP